MNLRNKLPKVLLTYDYIINDFKSVVLSKDYSSLYIDTQERRKRHWKEKDHKRLEG